MLKETYNKEKEEWQHQHESTLITEKSNWQEKLDSLQQTHGEDKAKLHVELESIKREKEGWQNERELIKNEVTAESAKVAVQKEQIYKLESDKEEL